MADALLMLCTGGSLERLIESGTVVNEDGILPQSKLSTSALDLNDAMLEDLKQFFAPDAYRTICRSGMLACSQLLVAIVY